MVDGQEIEGIYDEEKELLIIEDYINDDGENDSDYAPSEIDEDDIEEQIECVEDNKNNIDTEKTENVITDNEEDDNENMNDESEDNKDMNDEIIPNEENDEMSESENANTKNLETLMAMIIL